jgi:hypothetical protein
MRSRYDLLLGGLLGAASIAWLLFALSLIMSTAWNTAGGDFYQLWLGAHAVLTGDAPYGTAVKAEMLGFYGVWGVQGLPYPAPAFLIITPLALFPATVAAWLWLVLCLLGVASAVLLGTDRRWNAAILLVFAPLLRTVQLFQPTLMYVALAALLIGALDRRRGCLAGFCLAVLPSKPQAGLVFAVAGGIYALRHHRAAAAWAIAWVVVLWGGACLVVPDWVQGTWEGVLRYHATYTALVSLLPFGLLVVVAAYRLPWWAIAAVAQVVLFPMHEVYGMTPALLAWIGVGGPLGVLGAAISSTSRLTRDVPTQLWVSHLLPLALAALWRAAPWRRLPRLRALGHCSAIQQTSDRSRPRCSLLLRVAKETQRHEQRTQRHHQRSDEQRTVAGVLDDRAGNERCDQRDHGGHRV